ncbi:MAG: AAA family ATPase [Candidatus Tectimicrobiota bacterium]
MGTYPFHLVRYDREGPLEDTTLLLKRPFVALNASFTEDAKRFVPGEQLEIAINTALAVGAPLLITGEPGTGKTQAAYYAAYKLGIEPVLHFQVKSDSSARDLLYHFDTVRYFHDAHLGQGGALPAKAAYVERRALWEAMASPMPRVLLIDEIDKAPRDFPNDLLHELDQMEFTVVETQETIRAPKAQRPLVCITSNSERRLPEPFLRRCVYHHIRFDDALVLRAVDTRREEYAALPRDFVALAVQRFLALRDRPLRKRPSTGELLVWLRVLALAVGTYPERLEQDLSQLPYLGVLLKDHQDIEDLRGTR